MTDITISLLDLSSDWLERDREQKLNRQMDAYRDRLRRQYLRQRRRELRQRPDVGSDDRRTAGGEAGPPSPERPLGFEG